MLPLLLALPRHALHLRFCVPTYLNILPDFYCLVLLFSFLPPYLHLPDYRGLDHARV